MDHDNITIACMQIKVTDMQMKVLANYDNFFFFFFKTSKPKIIKCRSRATKTNQISHAQFNVIIKIHNFMWD
jgi:hypothetical protein